MLNEHGMQNAKPVVTLAVNRNDDDDEDEEASAEEHRSFRVLGTATSRHCFCYEPSGEVSGKTFKVGRHCVAASLAISARYAGSRTEAASAKQCSPTAIGLEIDPHASPVSFVGNHAGWILDQCWCPNTVRDCSIVM